MSLRAPLRVVGERAVLVELPGNATVRKLVGRLPAVLAGVEEIVAGHDTLLISWEPGRQPPADLAQRIADLLDGRSAPGDHEHADVPVIYDGPDLHEVAAALGVSPEEFVRRHQATRFEVGFVGFSPGFAYLLGGDHALQPPRRSVPRERVPSGSLAIAGEYTAIYPQSSPGGWNLIGRALVTPFDEHRAPQALLRTGMTVRFTDPA